MEVLKRILIVELILGFFLLGGVLGINIAIENREQQITNLYIELEDEKEKNYQLNLENKKLKTILNNYTIQERKIN